MANLGSAYKSYESSCYIEFTAFAGTALMKCNLPLYTIYPWTDIQVFDDSCIQGNKRRIANARTLRNYNKKNDIRDLRLMRVRQETSRLGPCCHDVGCGTQRLFVKFHTSPEQSSKVRSALHCSSTSARRTSATQKPTSPALLPTSRAGICLCEACSRL
jgi:hypothetical protein